MNRTNCRPGGIASFAARTEERHRDISSQGGRARAKYVSRAKLSEYGRKGGTIAQARRTPEERSASASHAAKARWNTRRT